jgi:Immunity protein 26
MAIRKEGAFFEIKLPNGKFSYGRILPKATYAFYDIYSENKISDINEIDGKKVLFRVAVHNDAISKNRWKILGTLPLVKELMILPLKFIQDELEPSQFEIYEPNTGKISPATKVEVIGLERAAVWDPEYVEDRIIDHFEGRPNRWFESLKIRE